MKSMKDIWEVKMKILGSYTNGNFRTAIFEDGTKIRETNDDEFQAAFAENMDIKITNYCDMGCPFCHEGSTTDGKFGDIDRKSTRLNSSHPTTSRMPSSA